ncbi:MAG: DUF58 domain-containing protein [Eubacterium sp.]|nr:DUF58 domain-containing protein [Eubacterium sp.]
MSDKQRNSFRPHLRPFRVAGYLTLFFSVLFMYLGFRSFLLLMFLFFLVVFPLISILIGILIAGRIRVDILSQAAAFTHTDDDVFPAVIITNPLFMGTLDARIELGVSNGFFDTETQKLVVSLPGAGKGVIFRKKSGRMSGQDDIKKGESRLVLPFKVTRIGVYGIRVMRIEVQDPLGLVRFRIRTDENREPVRIITLPDETTDEIMDAEAVAAGMTEVEESDRRGNDFSEVTDIKEYAPGDRIRDIHWKLSARNASNRDNDGLMVKVRTQMSGLELSVVIAPDDDPLITEEIIHYAYGKLSGWCTWETDIHLYVYSRIKFGFDSYVISSIHDLENAFGDILSLHYRDRIADDGSADGLDVILRNLYPFMSGYIRIGVGDDGRAGMFPAGENG